MTKIRRRQRCPKCGSLNIILWGSRDGRQRYRIERECLSWLTQHPKSSAGITLRRLVTKMSYIKTHNDKLFWLKELMKWHEDNEEFIKQKTVNKETGEMTYTHDSVRRAYIHLYRAIPNMFKHLYNRTCLTTQTVLNLSSGI